MEVAVGPVAGAEILLDVTTLSPEICADWYRGPRRGNDREAPDQLPGQQVDYSTISYFKCHIEQLFCQRVGFTRPETAESDLRRGDFSLQGGGAERLAIRPSGTDAMGAVGRSTVCSTVC
ncbi:MAG: hypothetical protein RIS70_2601 [Planctomycetota bacterium]